MISTKFKAEHEAVRKLHAAIAAAKPVAAPKRPRQETARERMLREQRAQLGKNTDP